jgi:hypothetical protein
MNKKEWDSAHRKSNDENNTKFAKQKFKYSTCDGLRLVESITKEILFSSTMTASNTTSSSASVQDDQAATFYSDLTQEGIVVEFTLYV